MDLKRLKELAERAPQVDWETNPDVENSDGISLYFNNPYAGGQREIIAAVYWPCHGMETLAEIEHKWPAITMMFALLSPPKVLELIAEYDRFKSVLTTIGQGTYHGLNCVGQCDCADILAQKALGWENL